MGVLVAAELFDQLDYAVGFFEIRAQFRLKGYFRKVFYAVGKLFLLIDFPEKPGVVEAGFQDSFVAFFDFGRRGRRGMFITATKCGARTPGAVSTAKYFWWWRITMVRTSAGSSR